MHRRTVLVLVSAAALLLCYASTMAGMFRQWLYDSDMSHGLLVPVAIAWVLWRERKGWGDLPANPSAWGWPVLAAGAGMQLAGALGGGLFASSVALLISSVAVVILLGGFDLFRRWTFPFVLSLFMVPKLAIVYNQGTLPLQLMASRLAAWLLWVTGFGVSRQGNILEIHGRQIFVAEACNGLRYLLPLAFIAMLLGYLSGVKPWARWVLFLASVPVAVLANALRVALVGVAPALGVGALHEATGLLVFAIAVVPLFAVSRFFRRFPAGSHV